MGVYILFLYMGATLAPLLGGFIFNGMGWQAVLVGRSPSLARNFSSTNLASQYFNGGFNTLVALFLFFFLEETNFERPETQLVGPATSAADPTLDLRNTISISDKKEAFDTSVQESPIVQDPTTAAQPELEDTQRTTFGKPWLTFGTRSPYAAAVMLRGCLVPMTLLALPLVWWIGLMYGIYQIWFNSECISYDGLVPANSRCHHSYRLIGVFDAVRTSI